MNINTELISHNNVERSNQIPTIVDAGQYVLMYSNVLMGVCRSISDHSALRDREERNGGIKTATSRNSIISLVCRQHL